MSFIKIDKDLILENIYYIRSKVDLSVESNQEVIKAIESLVQLIANAPQADSQAQFPRIRIRRG